MLKYVTFIYGNTISGETTYLYNILNFNDNIIKKIEEYITINELVNVMDINDRILYKLCYDIDSQKNIKFGIRTYIENKCFFNATAYISKLAYVKLQHSTVITDNFTQIPLQKVSSINKCIILVLEWKNNIVDYIIQISNKLFNKSIIKIRGDTLCFNL